MVVKIEIRHIALVLMLLIALVMIKIIIDLHGLDLNNSGSLGYSNMNFNISRAPLEQFCKDINMTYFEDSTSFIYGSILYNYNHNGCYDKNSEKHYYEPIYSPKTGNWSIGNNSYKAKWTGEN